MADEAFEVGSVTSFAGATGLLEALRTFLKGTEVSAESLSGSGTSWSGTLANSPVGYGRLSVDYTIAGTPYTATDDGAGNIVGTNITAGTITYSSGAYSITFSASPTGTPTADYIYGEPGQDWKELEYYDSEDDNDNTPWGSSLKTCIFQNTGLSGQEQVMVGIREWQYTGGNAYGWNLNGYQWHISGMNFMANILELGVDNRGNYNSTYETWDEMPNMPLIDSTIYYWFFSNRQRFIVVAKVQSNYEACYLGFGNRYASPSRYPTPLIVKGSHHGASGASHQDDGRHGVARNYWGTLNHGYPLLFLDPGGNYRHNIGNPGYLNGAMMIPGDTHGADGEIGPDAAGEIFSLPVSIGNYLDGAVWADLDGVIQFWGPNLLSEDFMRDIDNKKKYLVFQDVYRTGFQDFYGVFQMPYTSTTTTTTTTA